MARRPLHASARKRATPRLERGDGRNSFTVSRDSERLCEPLRRVVLWREVHVNLRGAEAGVTREMGAQVAPTGDPAASDPRGS